MNSSFLKTLRLLFTAGGLLGSAAALACDSSDTNICVTLTGGGYSLNGFPARAPYPVTAGVSVTFEAAETFTGHGFILTASPEGGSTASPIDGPLVPSGGTFTYTPTDGAVVYYQCSVHPNEGGQLTVEAAASGGGGGAYGGAPGGSWRNGPGQGNGPTPTHGCSATGAASSTLVTFVLAVPLLFARRRRSQGGAAGPSALQR